MASSLFHPFQQNIRQPPGWGFGGKEEVVDFSPEAKRAAACRCHVLFVQRQKDIKGYEQVK